MNYVLKQNYWVPEVLTKIFLKSFLCEINFKCTNSSPMNMHCLCKFNWKSKGIIEEYQIL